MRLLSAQLSGSQFTWTSTKFVKTVTKFIKFRTFILA
jgi:hypothetical protein